MNYIKKVAIFGIVALAIALTVSEVAAYTDDPTRYSEVWNDPTNEPQHIDILVALDDHNGIDATDFNELATMLVEIHDQNRDILAKLNNP